MKDWDAAKLGECLAGVAASNPVLDAVVQRLSTEEEGTVTPGEILGMVDVLLAAQTGLVKAAEEDAEEHDRKKYGKGDVASSAASVLAAAL